MFTGNLTPQEITAITAGIKAANDGKTLIHALMTGIAASINHKAIADWVVSLQNNHPDKRRTGAMDDNSSGGMGCRVPLWEEAGEFGQFYGGFNVDRRRKTNGQRCRYRSRETACGCRIGCLPNTSALAVYAIWK